MTRSVSQRAQLGRGSLVLAAGILFAMAGAATALAQAVPAEAPAEAPSLDSQPRGDGPPARFDALDDIDYFTEAEWRALVAGKTLTYMTPYGLMGREYYPPEGNRVIFVYFDGRCFDGTWSMADNIYCFQYDGLHCFEHFRRGDDIIARELDGDEQLVTDITDEVLSCEPELLSRAPRAPRLSIGAPG